ncbi:acyl-CoA dehydrogenase family protein [Cellulomonas oligotrophica]|uniref:Acyl-CoA dehydrogenase n=1 Tax=Cellulomonas oligotrophica TaxID=931536 RepID=A0A7Y9FCK1_9CELL|nr:acyl-CoA dehydrogenase family protein [Cellulomonas oligotrophica]NYD84836.1 alkylation response protein AidB-like acyl-CoA dehydrogenase [Cellulomonas oligotrophica]GIG31905.1 acyl-CoA dehydrogenase [Cellulomonas oligotrophica]
MTRRPRTLLTDDLLAAVHARAAQHDRDNTFPHDDLADLVAAGYLRAFVPVGLGGAGLTLEEVAREQARLAAAAPATALAVNMHLVVTGLAAHLLAHGDDSVAFVLRDAAAGEVYAFGNSEAGNDLVMFGSRTRAVPQADGGYRYTGTKIFTSLSPVWTRLATFGLDDSDPGDPRLVHGVVSRGEGVHAKDDWDTLGMRATQSATTVLDGAYAPPGQVYRRLPPGPSADPFVFALFAVFEVLLAAVYTGIGRRALELGVEHAHRRTSMKHDGRPYAQDPDIRWKVADAALAQDGAELQVFALARDVDEDADHGARWFAQLVGLKVRATESARVVVDLALRVSGGGAYSSGSELARLYRDVLAGIYHPSDDESAHGTVATSVLGPPQG